MEWLPFTFCFFSLSVCLSSSITIFALTHAAIAKASPSCLPYIGGKTSMGPSYFLCKIFIPSYAIDVLLLCQNSLFLAPNCLTLQITPMYTNNPQNLRGL
jgi:hypothetical protein